MKHIFYSILLAVFLSPLFSSAQVKVGYQQRINRDSRAQIKELQQGVLLVRLQNKAYTIQALKDAGRADDAAKVEAKQLEINQEIVTAFIEGFDFCPVYFFNSSDSRKVMAGNISEIGFLNSKLEIDSTIKCDNEFYYIAEFSSIEQDTASFYRTSYFEWDKKGPEIKQYRSGSGTYSGQKALVIRSRQLIQLKKPFPYFVKENKIIVKRDKGTMVQMMNNQLKGYYNYNGF
jgi:hypothetical protein